MNVEAIEKQIAKLPKRRIPARSPLAQKMKDDLAERRASLADYFWSVSEPIEIGSIGHQAQ